jgi:hypothetical protein
MEPREDMRAAAAAAVLVAAGLLAAYPFALAPPHPVLVLACLMAAVLIAVALITRATVAAGAGATLLAAQYIGALFVGHHGVDVLAPAYAVVWFAFIELLDVASAWPAKSSIEGAVVAGRLRFSIVTAGLATVVAWIAVFMGAAVTSGFTLLVVGLLAALGALSLPVIVGRSSFSPSASD